MLSVSLLRIQRNGAPVRGSSFSPLSMFSGGTGLAGIIASPIIGFMVLILSRAFAEQIRAMLAVSNNTKLIERNTKH